MNRTDFIWFHSLGGTSFQSKATTGISRNKICNETPKLQSTTDASCGTRDNNRSIDSSTFDTLYRTLNSVSCFGLWQQMCPSWNMSPCVQRFCNPVKFHIQCISRTDGEVWLFARYILAVIWLQIHSILHRTCINITQCCRDDLAKCNHIY